MSGEDEPVDDGEHRHKHSLDLRGSTPRALARVRRWIAAQLASLDSADVQTVVQIADELTANAYEHGGGPHAVHLIHQRYPCRTTVEVDDSNTAAPTLGESRFGAAAHRGRGLVLVDQLAHDWGVAPSDGGKTVWAHVSCQAPPRNRR
jgi:anti-sigma regulatory factor (Ser/Thr protein kinase)